MAYLDKWFKWIRWYEGYYSINRDGEIASYHKLWGKGKWWVLKEYPQSFLKPQVQNKCLVVNLNDWTGQKRFRVKRLVAEAFLHSNRNSKEEIYHKDRDFHNCNVDNLYFSKKHSDVMKHYVRTPTREKKHIQIQMNKIEKRQEKIEAKREKLDKELAEVREYFNRIS